MDWAEIAELGRDAYPVIAPPGWRLASRASFGLYASHGGRHLTQYLHIRAVGTLAGNMPDHHAARPVEFARGPQDGDPRRYCPEFPR